ncbi:MAG: hypothetical protein Q4C20_00685 [Erysipelotrichaceae bacterium]|nr:hypothetical protein [Erysipelotrichaceae bacterium]
MTEKEYKERLNAFKNSCRVYKYEKKMLQEADMRKNGFGDDQLYSYMREDIGFVDGMFDTISAKCGVNARLMIWLLFVDENTQADVAYRFGLTRRQLQYSVNKWMHQVFEAEGRR